MSRIQLKVGRTLAASTLFIAATASVGFAQCPADDATTTNNDCVSAAAGTIGTVAGLSVQGGSEDFWSYTVPAGQELAIDCLFVDSTADVDLNLYDDGTCTIRARISDTVTDNETVVYANSTGVAVDVVLRVFIWQNPPGACNDYDLVASLAPDPCILGVDDGEEDNDTCLTAVAPSATALSGLFVSVTDEDFYSYNLAAGEILDIRLDYINAAGDVDAQLLDASDCTTVLTSANFSFSDFEDLNYANDTGAAQTVVLRVLMDTFTNISSNCNSYDLSSTVTIDPCFVPIDDLEEENDTCATAVVPSANPLLGMFASKTDPDYYIVSVPSGEVLTVDATFAVAMGNLELRILSADCGTELDSSTSFGDNETGIVSNLSGAAVDMVIEITHRPTDTASNCNVYDLSWFTAPDPCFLGIDDGEEENDTCLTAVVPSSSTLFDLFVSQEDEDFYSYTVMSGGVLDVDLSYESAYGDVDAQIISSTDCSTVFFNSTSGLSDNDFLTYTNLTSTAQTVILRVYVDANSSSTCNLYDLSTSIEVDPCSIAIDDMFEENDDCSMAAPVSPGVQIGLLVFKENVDEDWYSADVPDGATITVRLDFNTSDGDLEMDLFDGCGGTLLDASATIFGFEMVTWTNTTGATVNVKWTAFVWAGDATENCNIYNMTVDIQGGIPTNLIPYCFGDGSGAACPCGNSSAAGHPGGCANSGGDGAVLVATGNPTVGADTLSLDLSSASLNSFALLVSGVNQLPQTGGCTGCGILAFDGLRCAGGGFLRHGSRALDGAGATGNGWGPPGGPAGGLIAANGFMVGQTRNFFAFYRDDVAEVCQTGQNSSNGIQVIFN